MPKRMFILILLSISALLVSCASRPYGHYKNNQMIGTVQSVDPESGSIEVHISEWHKRDVRGGVEDYGVFIPIEEADKLVMSHEDGSSADIDQLKVGQKVLVKPPKRIKDDSYEAKELVLLEMSYEEKYASFLSPSKSRLETTVMGGPGYKLTPEMEEQLMGLITNKNSMGFGGEFTKNHVVDFEKELGIEKYPVMLVFDHKQLLFKTYDIDELAVFLKK